jgi:hypothetical protein
MGFVSPIEGKIAVIVAIVLVMPEKFVTPILRFQLVPASPVVREKNVAMRAVAADLAANVRLVKLVREINALALFAAML